MPYLRRLKLTYEPSTYPDAIHGPLRGPRVLYRTFKDLKDEVKETLLGVYLSHDLVVQSYEVLSIGSSDESTFAPDEIFRGAILTNSHYLVLIHNHPSGQTEPSDGDRQAIALIRAQAKIMRRALLDFIIVGAHGYWSQFDEDAGGEYSQGARAA